MVQLGGVRQYVHATALEVKLFISDDFVETFHDSVRDVGVAVSVCQVGEVGEDGVAVTEGGSGPVVVHDEEACGVEQLIGETGCEGRCFR